MKNLIIISTLAIAVYTTGCKKKEDDKVMPQGLIVQAHDENEMMKLMHAMDKEMMMMKMTGDTDYDFALMMKGHHQGALNMANLELAKGTNAEVKAMAQKIKDAQTSEIAMLDMYMKMNTPKPNVADSAHLNMEMMMSMQKMASAKDLQNITGNIDNDFASLIIPHHQSAIEMAQSEIEHGKNPEMIAMAKMTVMDQTKEIIEFQKWLLKNKPATAPMNH